VPVRQAARPIEALGVFAVEDTTAQLTWRALPAGPVSARVTGRAVEVDADGGPGALVLEDLAPARQHPVTVTAGGLSCALTVRTLATPPGPLLTRVATVGDLHLAGRSFGARGTVVERPRAVEASSVRCARAALAEAVAWGADLVVVKGDVTQRGRSYQWRVAAELLAEVPVPVVVLPGNHDRAPDRTTEPWMAGAELGLRVVRGTDAVDLPGVRVVMADTTIAGRSRGRLSHRTEEVVTLAAGAPSALVVLHHQLELHPELPLWPPGVPRAEADRFLDALAEAQPAALVTSGHTHRHRRRRHGPITVTSVGSTKDYPGVWAGYAVHEGGIRQVVRRVADPDCLRWTELTRRGVAHQWGRLSPGRLDERCFSLDWPGPQIVGQRTV